jgi:cation diffusion facilitator CzcD-associated flavoprotein CzcO
LPPSSDEYPARDDVVRYLANYEARYDLPIERPVLVRTVTRRHDTLHVATDRGIWVARAVVSATGTWANPVAPFSTTARVFRGVELHSALYSGPEPFRGRRVVVVGGGNSGAQIAAELTEMADVQWVTRTPPRFLADGVDGRALFAQATERYLALRDGRPPPPALSLGDIVAVPVVRAARERGLLQSVPLFDRLDSGGPVWPDGTHRSVDAVIWAIGFRPALAHLESLGVLESDGRIATQGTRAVREPRLWLVGYGDWAGYASATLIGVGRSARATVGEIMAALGLGEAAARHD